ncbi:hypothetical protein WN53_16910 [Serratia fonticola]|nr:hypothetical protein WN53_16910 [Serratia fonticola]
MKYYAEKSANSFGLLSFWERELSGVADEAVLLRNVMRKKMEEVLRRKISELDRSPLLLGEGVVRRR